ncbi:MAG: sensor histidine kinase [Candidatus Kapaibacteriales bacterium]
MKKWVTLDVAKVSNLTAFAKLNRFVIYFIILLFLLNQQLYSDNTFPRSYSIYQILPGGSLEVINTNNTYYSFFVKPTFGEFAESVFFWKGIRRDKVIGIPTVPPSILSSKTFKDYLIIISTQNHRLFVSALDTNLELSSITELPTEGGFYDFTQLQWLDTNQSGELLVLINKTLYTIKIDFGKKKIYSNVISNNALSGCFLDYKNFRIAVVNFEEGNGMLYFIDSNYSKKFVCRIDLSDEVRIQQLGKWVIVVSSSKFHNSSLFHIIASDHGLTNKFWIESRGNRASIYEMDGKEIIAYLRSLKSGYLFVIAEFDDFLTKKNEIHIPLPSVLSESFGIFQINNLHYCVFRNGICILDQRGKILANDLITIGEHFPESLSLCRINNFLILKSKTSTLVLEEKKHSIWFITRFLNNFGKILIPFLLLIIIFIILRKFYKQRWLLKALIEAPTTGVVFIIDKYGRLHAVNNSAKDMLGITESVPLRRMFTYYCRFDYLEKLNEIVEKSITTRESFMQKVNFIRNSNEFEWLFTVLPLTSFMGKFKGSIITGTDITEVLGRQKLTNLAQLAHDMQTNLSTIRLNAEQITTNNDSKNEERKRKILHQTQLLTQRVRDIVTVGRGEIVLQEVDAYDLCMEARSEFDENVFPNVKFELDLKKFIVQCDRPKMIRAIRNAIENAIKAFQGKPGTIKVKNWSDHRQAYVAIIDNGPGMDKNILEKFLKPYFTTGGTGLGTMIIQHVVELHGGTIYVHSEKNVGTEITLSIPIKQMFRNDRVKKKLVVIKN